MPWRAPLLSAMLGVWPVWVAEGAVVAISAQDWTSFMQAAGVAVGTAAAGVAGAWVVYLKAYEGSAKQQLDQNTLRLGVLERDNADLKAENADLKAKLAQRDAVIDARDRTIRERDETIVTRDRAIEEQLRLQRRMGGDVADMAEAFLIRKGDAKSKVAP